MTDEEKRRDRTEERAREAYARQHPGGVGWDDLPDFMRAIWRRHVTTGVPPR